MSLGINEKNIFSKPHHLKLGPSPPDFFTSGRNMVRLKVQAIAYQNLVSNN